MSKNKSNLILSDNEVLSLIKAIIMQRPTYGYRRVCSILNQSLNLNKAINHKRVYRIMKQHSLLHMPYGKKHIRVHDGKIITMRSNLRWCSDSFTINCYNSERVQIAFALDCCDREVIGYTATPTGGIDSEMICDLIANCVVYRFGDSCELPNSMAHIIRRVKQLILPEDLD